jgi:hypothetical protein
MASGIIKAGFFILARINMDLLLDVDFLFTTMTNRGVKM